MRALLSGRRPARRNPIRSFIRRQGSRRWLIRIGLASVPMDRFVGRVSHGRITMLGVVGLPSLILTTTGRRSGLPRSQPLLYTPDGDGLVVVGSNWGNQDHPLWSANLLANPDAVIELRGRQIPVRASLAEGAERERLWRLALAQWPAFMAYDAATERTIRVFRLVPQSSD